MSRVYKAKDIVLDRYVAVKMMSEQLKQNQELIYRFIREAKLVGRFSHPNIVNVFDAGRDDDLYYMVMEYIEGVSLKDWIQKKKLSLREIVSIGIQICEGLDYAHKHGIIHRDIKPHNILITLDGHVKVSDFGISRFVEGGTQLTETDVVIGTVHYFSPEQASGAKLSFTSDIYSFGIMLYEMVTGEVPFKNGNSVIIAYQHIEKPLPDPRKFNPNLPKSLYQIIDKATQKKPGDRYSSAMDIALELKWTLLEIEKGQNYYQIVKSYSKKRAWTIGIGILAILLGLLITLIDG
ncbi:protein kinase domain-containing protein [Thermoflavimicrobium daqui]|nr:protein kinase [Thermoflavimicrobium daqui]